MATLLAVFDMLRTLLAGGDPALPAGHNELAPLARGLAALADYMYYVRLDGDYLNDYLTHVPQWARLPLGMLGYAVALYRQLRGLGE